MCKVICILGLSLCIMGCGGSSNDGGTAANDPATTQAECEAGGGTWQLCGDETIDLPGCPAATYACFDE